MSRVIKFRGMANDETESPKVWKYGYYKAIRKQHRIMTMEERGWYSWAVDGETVGQFTGLLDKNGAEVFEGDLLRIDITYEKYPEYSFDGIYKVSIDHRGVQFRYVKLAWEDGDKNQYPLRVNISAQYIYERWHDVEIGCHFNEYDKGETKSKSIEIIGNIHENKELLK